MIPSLPKKPPKVISGTEDFGSMKNAKAFKAFDPIILEFLDYLSKKLLTKKYKDFSDIATFAFFIRKANLSRIKKGYGISLNNLIGRGLSFHIAPSNVPINFAYSLITGLCSGNNCIVRLSSKDFIQNKIVTEEINDLLKLKKFKNLNDKISIVQYEKDKEINKYFSIITDVRIIWGGDDTINELRKFPIKPKATEVCFPDRYSICIINSNEYLKKKTSFKKIAQNFFNDTYFFDQNACSSPRLIFWYGNDKDTKKSKKVFWNHLESFLVEKKYDISPFISSSKLLSKCMASIDLDNIRLLKSSSNLIERIQIDSLHKGLEKYNVPGGLFFEFISEEISDLKSFVDEKLQTITTIGMDKSLIKNFVIDHGLKGIDRIVENGRAAEFSFNWDGYDLIFQLTRKLD